MELNKKIYKLTDAGKKFVDVDKLIEKRLKMSVGEIFEKKGERFFRELEKKQLAKLAWQKNLVIACGGGAVLDTKNVLVIKKNSHVVWLWVPIKEILNRTKKDFSRPLFNSENKEKQVRELLKKRLLFYGRASDLVVGTAGKNLEIIARVILDEVGKTIEG